MSPQPSEPIAIVGSACCFPGGADSPTALWNLLKSPRSVAKDIPDDRFHAAGFYHPDGAHHGSTCVRQSYLVDRDIRLFDSTFFNISPNEADSIDPQHRLLLETVYEALESGGHRIESLRGSDTSVYTGTMNVDYHDTWTRDPDTTPRYLATGINRAIISNRVSYFFDWHGPSMTIDTACSSSLVAVHQAVQSLRSGESRTSLACGTQVILNPEPFIMESKLNMLSPTSRSRMWDADADGYARGEGVAAIVLKKLSDAIADGDHIECIIRETGSNQDGYSNGITVPSTEAQAALIRQTYARAGLHPEENAADRPQYFEAHGTGTKAGDPKEAAAIHRVFGRKPGAVETTAPLYVGSVKTVIGHLEGAAGLAGLLKAANMVRNGNIVPNLLFSRLNPDIEPYYKGLQVPTKLIAWPELPKGVPRRVSVNSFGFGGTNAHAIIEQYSGASSVHALAEGGEHAEAPVSATPFVFSAVSEASLVAQLQSYSQFLENRTDISPSDLAWTLQARRSEFSTRVAFAASSIEHLQSKIASKLKETEKNSSAAIGVRAKGASKPKILGVFTGQGAQWPAMGAELIRTSAFVRARIADLQDALATLPAADRPTWKLADEMLAEGAASRVAEAALSQPLCTAVQVVLVDLLKEANVSFDAVVGHSSGEIAAAYAAGYLSARDAIRIAYYRGHIVKQSSQRGAMLAVGTSIEDARELVNLRAFRGRLSVAAHNSSASVTISGDADAVVHAKKVFDEEKKFARLLKVEKAYHSHHMAPCGDAYIEVLRACKAGEAKGEHAGSSCQWFSSVAPSASPVEYSDALHAVYWRDNLVNPVLFADAVRNAVASDDQIGLVVEVGPHPALKGPATQTISDIRDGALPYCGTLSRGNADTEAFADGLGFLWSYLGSRGIDFKTFSATLLGKDAPKPRLVVGLPSYQWNHSRSHWSEPRRSRRILARKHAAHEVLGTRSPDSNAHDLRWTNVLKASEIPWLNGHKLQGQTVFPAAGYVAMALEASRTLDAPETPVKTFELRNLSIPKAIPFDDSDSLGVEVLITLTGLHRQGATSTATFSCYALPISTSGQDKEMDLVATGTVEITFGNPSADALPSLTPEDHNMFATDSDRFYESLQELGYGYSGPFRALQDIKRKLNHATGNIDAYRYSTEDRATYLIHPSTLDTAFQLAMAACSAPGDGQLWSLHVPTSIASIRVNPAVCERMPLTGASVPSYAAVDPSPSGFTASIDLLDEDSQNCMVRIEDLVIQPFAGATKADDRMTYTFTKFGLAAPDGNLVVEGVQPPADEVTTFSACERIAFYYHRKWRSEITDAEWSNGPPHQLLLRDWVNDTVTRTCAGEHPALKKEWAQDTAEDIQALAKKHWDHVVIRIITAVGENMAAAVRGQTTILEHMTAGGMLTEYYEKGAGISTYHGFLRKIMEQVVHRYPRSKIIEIGAGTGGATGPVLDVAGPTMSSYTYTDISPAFFEQAAKTFTTHGDKMAYRVLDIEQNPETQGYEPHSYDIVIAFNVLHATHSLKETLENTRRLLKHGGYLVLMEFTNNNAIRVGTTMAGLPGWWLGAADGRKFSPTVTTREWHTVLRQSGFGGVDTETPEIDGITWPLSIMVAQATDERVGFLRRPLTVPGRAPVHIDNLVILGTGSLQTSRIAEELSEQLARFCDEITVLDGLPTEKEAQALQPMSTFINLADLDDPIFKNMTEEKMKRLQRMFTLANHVLWVTNGALAEQPYHMASVVFSRTVRREETHIGLNHLDISDLGRSDTSKSIAEHLLRMYVLEDWESDKQLLWSKETEVFLNSNNKLTVPRLLPDEDRNPRLNAMRRNVTKSLPASSSTTNAQIVQRAASSSYDLVEVLDKDQDQNAAGRGTTVDVRSSSLMALRIRRDAFLYLAAQGETTENRQLLLSATNSMKASPIARSTVAAKTDIGTDDLVVAVTAELLSDSVIQDIPPGARLLLHCSSQDLAIVSALRRRGASKGVHFIVCGADVMGEANSKDLTFVDLKSRASQHAMRRTLTMLRPSHYLDLTASVGQQSSQTAGFSSDIARALPSGCRSVDAYDFVHHQSSFPEALDEQEFSRYLDTIVTAATSGSGFQKSAPGLVTPVQSIRDAATPHYATSVVSWPAEGSLDISVPPLNPAPLFSADKSYLLTGLAGDIGRSLCEYMVAHGAGCVLLTSRRPQVDERWLASVQESGAKVQMLALDITDRSGAERVIANIRATCPPIAGVAHGANVLSDALFSRTGFEEMSRTLRPKIDGANTLDEIFKDDDLDFFVMFSSISSLAGNIGQSAYVAGNGYLNGLARQRRRRGKAGSAFDIGRVVGLGVIETVEQNVIDQLLALGLPPLNETELRLAFAEAILAGYPSPKDFEDVPRAVVTTTLRHFTDDEEAELKGPWFTSTLFSHLIHPDDSAGAGDQAGGSGAGSKATQRVGEQLAQATSMEQAREIIQECFSAKLQVILQILDDALDPSIPVVELGIDSLVAVEVRSWFLKELKVDIPVLKVVGGASIAELCEAALEKLPEGLLGNVGKEAASKASKPAKAEPHPLLASLQAKNAQQEQASSGANSSAASDSESNRGRGSNLKIPASSKLVSETSPPSSVTSTSPPSTSPAPVKGVPISFAQSRYWFLNQLLEDPRASNVAAYYHIQGKLRIQDLERANRIVLARHEALRTRFVQVDSDTGIPGGPDAIQTLLPRSLTQLKCEKANSKEEVEARFAKLREHTFDLASGDLLQMVLVTLSPTSHYLLVHHHHIVMDGVSVQVFLADLEKAYNYQSLGPLPRQYPEFSVTQRQDYDSGNMADELKYWKGVFPTGEQPPVLPLLPMSQSNSRVATMKFDTHEVRCTLEKDVAASIRQAARKQASTPFHFYLAAFHTMLFRYTDAQEIVIGMADAARNTGDLQNSVGFFLNLIPLRFRRQLEQRFADAITDVRKTSHKALETSRLPFDVLLTELGVGRSSLHSPLFQAFMDYRQGSQEGEQPWADCKLVMQESTLGKTAYDISLDITDTPAHALVTLRVQKSLYDVTAANLLLQTYTQLLRAFASDTTQSLSAPAMHSDEALAQAVQIGRGPALKSDWPETLAHRIDQVAQKSPDSVALMDGVGTKYTYASMLNRTQAIAEQLQNAKVGDGDRVVVYQQPAADWVCSMLAIMRIGAVYVPMDLRNPIARLVAVTAESAPAAILADSTTVKDVPQLKAPAQTRTINISDVSSAPTKAYKPVNRAQANSPAAILYTSGSTGTPKGISVSHFGLRNEIEGYTKTWKLGAERVLQQSAFTFDFATDELFTGLVNGGMVYIVPATSRGNPLDITQIIKQQKITYTRATPSEYLLWLQYGRENLSQASEWRFAFAGGETLTHAVTQELAALNHPQLRFYNSYGPAETSVSSCKMEVLYRDPSHDGSAARIPCGYSLPNYQTYIVDENLRAQPVGMPGEVCIGGAGVSLGYRNNPELTQRQFVPNPFATQEDRAQGWTKMYRTGDVGHLNENGALVFRGRVDGDTQVKVRGLRIDLADIEANIVKAGQGALREAVVTLHEGNADFLAGHVVFAKQHNVTDREAFLQRLLSQLPLPQYMVPVVLIPIDALPLTNHSKVDRKAVKNMPLPRSSPSANADGDLTETMTQLKAIWQDIVGTKIQELGLNIGPSTDFFLIGGNSLLMIRLQAQIQRRFRVALPLVKLLSQSTLAAMADTIEDASKVAVVDWDSETAPPSIPSFLADVPVKTSPPRAKTILVTGGTGFLARHLLPTLAADPHVASIQCIALREPTNGQPRTLTPSPKITWHEGDLTLPLLGLDRTTFRSLATEVDVILHLGAVRSIWDNYHTLRATNVHPTQELLKLAAPRRVPFYFVSTIGAAHGSPGSPAIAPATPTPSADGSNGYLASKWASERVLARAAETLGVPSTVLRFTPPSSGQVSPAPKRLMDELARFVDGVGAVPDAGDWTGRLYMSPVHEVTQRLVAGLVAAVDAESHGAKVEHWPCEVTLSGEEITGQIAKRPGSEKLERMPLLKWLGAVKKLDFDYFIASHEATVGGSEGFVSRR